MAVPRWIPVDITVPTSDKAIALDIKLGMERTWAFVAQLWFEASRYHQSGTIEGPCAAAIVAKRAGWNKDPEHFVQALLEARWLDQTPDGYRIHDWDKHAGAHIRRLDEEKEKVKEWRRKKAAERAEKKGKINRTKGVLGGNHDVTGNVPVTKRERTGTVLRNTEMEMEMEMESKASLLPEEPKRADSPLVAFLRETYSDIGDPCAAEAAWAKAYPRVDLLAEAVRARAWEVSNPKNAKTAHARFLNGWFSRCEPPPPRLSHGDLGAELNRWQDRLTPEQYRTAKAELEALTGDEGFPLGMPGDPSTHPVEAIAEINAKWRQIAEGRT